MLFRQLLNEPISAASYLIGCVASGQAAVIDPSLPAEQYALLAADRGLRVSAILETHMHADYISTGRALAALTGAAIYAPRLADVRFEHTPLDDGQILRIGDVALRALHTPGHTPEHTAYLVADMARAERPWFVLSGDCLFVGDVGRADLVDLPLTGPQYLFTSVSRLMELPDDVELFPGHYGGSACGGAGMSGKPASTIGFERRFNPMAQAATLPAFAALLRGTARTAVESVLLHRNTNRGELPLPEGYGRAAMELPAHIRPLRPEEAAAAVDQGATIVDVRDRLEFARSHPAGALSATYSSAALPGRVAALTEPGAPLLLLADRPFLARHAAALLDALGRNPVLGYLDGTPEDWRRADLPMSSLRLLRPADLTHRTAGVQLLDVRDPFEWEAGVLAGATLIAFGELRARLDELDRRRPLTVVCESGARAVAAASLLVRLGFEGVAAVAPGGMSEYLRVKG